MQLRGAMALTSVAMLAACAQTPVATNQWRMFPQEFRRRPRARKPLPVMRSSRRRRETQAISQPAAVQWHLVVLLAPGEPAYRREQDAVNQAIRLGVRDQLQVGNAAIKSGDNERATQAMLRVLALEPTNDEAAKALRDIDRQRISRIQGDRAQKLRPVDVAALKSGATEASAAYDLEQPLEMLRAGDVNGGLRELQSYVDSNPGNRAARVRIGNAVAERARDLASKGSREQAYKLYEQAVALRGDALPEWTTQMQVLRKALSDEYYSNGERAYRTDVALAIQQWETSLRYDPQNLKASTRLRDARAAQEKLKTIAPAKYFCHLHSCHLGAAAGAAPPNLSAIFFFSSNARSRSSLAFWLFGSISRMRSHLVMARSRF